MAILLVFAMLAVLIAGSFLVRGVTKLSRYATRLRSPQFLVPAALAGVVAGCLLEGGMAEVYLNAAIAIACAGLIFLVAGNLLARGAVGLYRRVSPSRV